MSLTPPPRPPPPRSIPQRREHHSSLPPALPPKERHSTVSLTLAEMSEKPPAPSHLVPPPPLPEPRQKRKETSPVGCCRSAVADHLANKVAPPLPVSTDDRKQEDRGILIPRAIAGPGNMTLPKNDSHSTIDPMRLKLDAARVGLKGKTIPRVSSDSHWPLDSVASSKKESAVAPVDIASAMECSVCLERPIDCVLYMCGHMCMCYECAIGLHLACAEGGSCPICRQTIRDVIKIYRS